MWQIMHWGLSGLDLKLQIMVTFSITYPQMQIMVKFSPVFNLFPQLSIKVMTTRRICLQHWVQLHPQLWLEYKQRLWGHLHRGRTSEFTSYHFYGKFQSPQIQYKQVASTGRRKGEKNSDLCDKFWQNSIPIQALTWQTQRIQFTTDDTW